jgi:hypothetical protein
MFSLSYFWHGILLNDFKKIGYSKEIFFPFLILLYLILGLGNAFFYSLFYDKKAPLMRGLLIGLSIGFTVFLLVFVLGTSLTGLSVNSLHVSVDFVWQLFEQSSGSLLIAYIYHYLHQREVLFH